MIDRTIAPKIEPIDGIHLTVPQQETLKNGIPFYILDNPQLDLIHIAISLKTGILYEEIKHTAQFSYALLKESSKKYNANEIADLFDFYGTHYTVSVNLDSTTINISVPKNNVAKILPVIFDFLVHPTYREENLEIYKNLKIKDLEYNLQKTDVQSTRLMLHAMFGDALTAGQFSTRENLQSVTIPQMEAFHHQTFCAENAILFATGNLSNGVKRAISEIFEQIPHGVATNAIHDIPMPADPRLLITETIPNSVQSSITLCQPMMGYTDDERCDFSILSTITGGYFGSRLMQNLREKNGYTYGISSGSAYFGNQSLFIINSDVNINHTKDSIEACFVELARLQEELIPNEELSTAKSYILGEQIRDLDNSVSILKRFMMWKRYGTDEREFKKILERTKSITAEELRELAKKHFSRNKFTQVVVGELR